jgi:hypothetical protein
LTFSVKAKLPTAIASDQRRPSRIPKLEFSELISLRPLERSDAVEPFDRLRTGSFDRLRAGFWNDWRGYCARMFQLMSRSHVPGWRIDLIAIIAIMALSWD